MKDSIMVAGMSCAACSVRIEKALSRIHGVISVYANFSSNVVTVEYDDSIVDHDRICQTIESAGYSVLERKGNQNDGSCSLMISLTVMIVFTIPLLVIAMGPMFGLTMIGDANVSALCQFFLCIPVVVSGRRFYLRGIPALIARSPTMDTLVALGSGTAFIYSTVIMVMILCGSVVGTHLYFDSAAMILTLVSVGKFLESRSRERTNEAVDRLRGLVPDEAHVIVNGKETVKNVSCLDVGEVLMIRPGERIPADGAIIDGLTSVDESMLTGESIPVNKDKGCSVFGGTLNVGNTVLVEVTAVGEGMALNQIIRMVEDAQCTKAPVARLADRVAARFVPIVISISVIACILWLLAGKDIGFALTVMISVLVISCPCAMGLATPLAITVGTGKAADHGILFKDAAALEHAGRIDVAIMDKTGTLTEGKLSVVSIYPADRYDEILGIAASAEYLSEHPIASAIREHAVSRGLTLSDVSGFRPSVGRGIECNIDSHEVVIGNGSFMDEHDIRIDSFDDIKSPAGATSVFVSYDGILSGIIALSDTVREGSVSSVSSLSSLDIEVKMVTGDTESAAMAVADCVGITEVHHSFKPEDKVNFIKRMQATGHDVAMVGDGINDAPSLAQSNLGITVGSGTDIAMESADVVIMNDDIRSVPATVEIGRATLRNIKENLFFAFCYNIVCIPIAAGLPYVFGMGLIESMPMISAAAMSLSSLSVVSNALRLKGFKPRTMSVVNQ